MSELRRISNGTLVPRREDFFSPFEQQFNKFFEEFWNPRGLDSVKASAGFPKINAYEKDGELVVTASASGMTKDDINVNLTPDNYLVLSGRVSEEYQSPDDAVWYVKELRQSAFERRIKLPANVEGDPTAELKDGMLTLTWKTKNYKKDPPIRKIQIKSG